MHLFVNVQFQTHDFGRGAIVYQVATDFTVNGINRALDYNYLYASSGGSFDASSWDVNGVLNVFPKMDLSTYTTTKPGNLFRVSLYNSVRSSFKMLCLTTFDFLTCSILHVTQSLTQSQILGLYNDRLPNSLPVVVNSTVLHNIFLAS